MVTSFRRPASALNPDPISNDGGACSNKRSFRVKLHFTPIQLTCNLDLTVSQVGRILAATSSRARHPYLQLAKSICSAFNQVTTTIIVYGLTNHDSKAQQRGQSRSHPSHPHHTDTDLDRKKEFGVFGRETNPVASRQNEWHDTARHLATKIQTVVSVSLARVTHYFTKITLRILQGTKITSPLAANGGSVKLLPNSYMRGSLGTKSLLGGFI